MHYLILSIAFFAVISAQASVSKKAAEPNEKLTTLSEMGIDFGAAELGRYAKLGLSEKQKKEALEVVRDRKPKIEKLCQRMTEVLAMSEANLDEKRAKEKALTKIQGGFKAMQEEIINKLHALVTEEQMEQLVAMKKREKVEAREREAKQRS